MSVTVEQVKCACPDCVCVVGVKSAITRDGKVFCSETCADHHPKGSGCDHAGCDCKG